MKRLSLLLITILLLCCQGISNASFFESFTSGFSLLQASPLSIHGGDSDFTTDIGIDQLDDQSTNAHNLVQAIDARQPTHNATDSNFNNRATIDYDGVDDNLSKLSGYADIPNNMSFATAVEFIGSGANQNVFEWFSGSVSTGCQLTYTLNAVRFRCYDTGGANDAWWLATPPIAPHIYSGTCNGSTGDLKLYVDGEFIRTIAGLDACGNSTEAKLQTAVNQNGFWGNITLAKLVLSGSVWSDAIRQKVEENLGNTYGIQTDSMIRNTVYWNGDSIIAGDGLGADDFIDQQFMEQIGDPLSYLVSNDAVSGRRCNTLVVPTFRETEHVKKADIIYAFTCGINDKSADADSNAQILGEIDTHVDAVIAAGIPAANIIYFTPHNVTTKSTEMQSFRDHFNANWATTLATGVRVVDTGNNANLLDPTDTTYFQGDQIHLTPTGILIMVTGFLAQYTP